MVVLFNLEPFGPVVTPYLSAQMKDDKIFLWFSNQISTLLYLFHHQLEKKKKVMHTQCLVFPTFLLSVVKVVILMLTAFRLLLYPEIIIDFQLPTE